MTFAAKVLDDIPQMSPEVRFDFACGHNIVAANARYVFPYKKVYENRYELVLTHYGFPRVRASKQDLLISPNHMLVLNPGQEHRAYQGGPVPLYNAVLIDKDFLDDISRQIGHKSSTFFKTVPCHTNSTLLNLIKSFMQELNQHFQGRQLMMDCMETQIAVAMLRSIPSNGPTASQVVSLRDKRKIIQVEEYLHQHYTEKISLGDLAQLVNYSTYHFIRVFKNETSKTPFEYLIDLKLKKAAEMLRNKSLSITEVCFASGFNNPAHFSTVFKRKLGVTPSYYQEHI